MRIILGGIKLPFSGAIIKGPATIFGRQISAAKFAE